MTVKGMKMKQKSQTRQTGGAKAIKDIRRATRKQYSAEEKIRIVLDGLRGEETIAELCRIEGIAQSIYGGLPNTWFGAYSNKAGYSKQNLRVRRNCHANAKIIES